jgi:hypothetical protein
MNKFPLQWRIKLEEDKIENQVEQYTKKRKEVREREKKYQNEFFFVASFYSSLNFFFLFFAQQGLNQLFSQSFVVVFLL